MKRILKYSQFINESYQDEEFSDLPWEEEMEGVIDSINSIRDELEDLLEDGDNTLKFNIKFYDSPDVEGISQATGQSAESIDDDFLQFKEDRLRFFCESLEEDYKWVNKTWVEGRSGGWLCVETDKKLNYIEDDIDAHVDDYLSMKREYNFPLTPEQMEEIDFFLKNNRLLYDLDLASKPQIIKDLYDTFQDSLKNLKEYEKDWRDYTEQIYEIKERIEKSKKNLIKDFESYFLENYGKNDQEV